MSYSSDDKGNFRRAAIFVDKIFEGHQAIRFARGTTDEV